MEENLQNIYNNGVKSVAIYGCGKFSHTYIKQYKNSPLEISFFIDDNPTLSGKMFYGIPIITSEKVFTQKETDAIIVSSDTITDKLFKKASYLFPRRKIFRATSLISPTQKGSNCLFKKDYNIFLKPYKAAYFWIPKVACTSLKKYFSTLLDLKPPTQNHGVHSIKFPSMNRQEILNSPEVYKFCFVRNPYDRLISCFKEKLREPTLNNKHFTDGVSNALSRYSGKFFAEMSFEEFIKSIVSIKYSESDEHFRPQHLFIFNEGQSQMNKIYNFESINEDFQELVKTLNFPKKIHLPHLLKSNSEEKSALYTLKLKEIVYSYYEEDFKLLGYPNEL